MKGSWLAGLGLVLTVTVRGAAQTDSLDLRTALALARDRSPALAAAAAAVREAAGRETVARSARGPRLGAEALYLRFQDPPSVGLGPFGTYAPLQQDGYWLGLQLTQPVYTAGRVANAVRAADWGSRAAELSASQAKSRSRRPSLTPTTTSS